MTDFFQKFKDVEEQKVRQPKPRTANILWSDPYGHFHCLLDCLKMDGEYRKSRPGLDFMLTDNVRIFYTGMNENLIPNEDFDICVTSRSHREGNSQLENAVRAEVLPYSQHATYTLYRDCCHGKAGNIASDLGVSHPVSTAICFELLAEMVKDIQKGEERYLKLGTDFAKAAELALQSGDMRKHELYLKFEENKRK